MGLVSVRHACRGVAFVLVLGGCGGGDSAGPGSAVDVAGTWSGRVSAANGMSATLEIDVSESASRLSGTGWLIVTGDSLGLSVSGSYDPPNMQAVISSQGFEPMDLTATVSEGEMVGTLDGSGFENRGITLKRQ